MGGAFTHRIGVFDGGAAAITIAVQDFTSATATGSNDYTSTTLTGITPAAALVVATAYNTSAAPNETTYIGFSIGATDGTSQFSASTGSADGSATDNGYQGFDQDFGLNVVTSAMSATSKRGTIDTISGGVNVNYSNADTAVKQFFFVGFGGADVQADVGAIALGTGTSAIGVTTGFQPDVVFLIGANTADNVSSAGNQLYRFTFGAALADGTQRCIFGGRGGRNPFHCILTNRVGGKINTGTGNINYHLTAGGFSGTGFEITPGSSASSEYIGYLALRFNGGDVSIVDLATPTSTGNQAITGAGFEPQAAIVILSNLEAADPSFPISTNDFMSGWSISAIADEQWTHSIRMDSGAASSDVGCETQALALSGPSATVPDAIAATLVSFDADGMTLNYSAVQGTARVGFIVFFK